MHGRPGFRDAGRQHNGSHPTQRSFFHSEILRFSSTSIVNISFLFPVTQQEETPQHTADVREMSDAAFGPRTRREKVRSVRIRSRNIWLLIGIGGISNINIALGCIIPNASNTPNTAPEAPIVTDPMRAANLIRTRRPCGDGRNAANSPRSRSRPIAAVRRRSPSPCSKAKRLLPISYSNVRPASTSEHIHEQMHEIGMQEHAGHELVNLKITALPENSPQPLDQPVAHPSGSMIFGQENRPFRIIRFLTTGGVE